MKVTIKQLRRKLFEGVFILVATMLIPHTVYAQVDAKQMLNLLKGYEWKLQAERFEQLGDNADLVLMEIAADNTLMNAYRFRALEALKLFPKERVAVFLENYIEQSQSTSRLRRAFEAFSNGFSETQPDRVQQVARKLLNNSNAHVRISAARALRKLDTSSARSTLRGYLSTEEEDWVREAIEE